MKPTKIIFHDSSWFFMFFWTLFLNFHWFSRTPDMNFHWFFENCLDFRRLDLDDYLVGIKIFEHKSYLLREIRRLRRVLSRLQSSQGSYQVDEQLSKTGFWPIRDIHHPTIERCRQSYKKDWENGESPERLEIFIIQTVSSRSLSTARVKSPE